MMNKIRHTLKVGLKNFTFNYVGEDSNRRI